VIPEPDEEEEPLDRPDLKLSIDNGKTLEFSLTPREWVILVLGALGALVILTVGGVV